MNNIIRTYGVVINMDYYHQPTKECKKIWNNIVQSMLCAGFHFDKRMFLMTTTLDKKYVCDKARAALDNIDEESEFYNKNSLNYITDFFITDMTEYVDLRLPPSDMGIILQETVTNNVYYSI